MIDAVLHALAEPNRREILRVVGQRELAAGEIASHFSISGPAVSQHLAVLVDSGLLTVRRDATRRLYRMRPDGLRELQAFLDSFWDEQLTTLKNAAEAEESHKRNRES